MGRQQRDGSGRRRRRLSEATHRSDAGGHPQHRQRHCWRPRRQLPAAAAAAASGLRCRLYRFFQPKTCECLRICCETAPTPGLDRTFAIDDLGLQITLSPKYIYQNGIGRMHARRRDYAVSSTTVAAEYAAAWARATGCAREWLASLLRPALRAPPLLPAGRADDRWRREQLLAAPI